jgi:predicted TIM-barrel fold metal-dependent hydrolase
MSTTIDVTRDETKTAAERSSFTGLKVVDTDTHITEWHDLWTSRATPKYKDRVPRVVKTDDGRGRWVIGEDQFLASDTGHAAVMKDGSKLPGYGFNYVTIDAVHPGAYNVKERVKYMDDVGIAAQIGYTNILGFGGQRAMTVDADLRLVSTQILNDALAEMQADSKNRIYPMTMLPWWDIDLCVKEAERGASMGLRGVNMNSGPHTHGLPDLADPHWDPLWDFCQSQGQPVNFHIGASDESSTWFGHGQWSGYSENLRMAFGSTMLFAGNMTVLINLFMSGMLDRHPKLKFCSVESGVGWVPFMLESVEYQMADQAQAGLDEPIVEKFRRHIYVCSWYEKRSMLAALDILGPDNLLFETDFPHPTCLYPGPLEQTNAVAARMSQDERVKMFQTNAEKLYNLDLSAAKPV